MHGICRVYLLTLIANLRTHPKPKVSLDNDTEQCKSKWPTQWGQITLKHWRLEQRSVHKRRWLAHTLRTPKSLKAFISEVARRPTYWPSGSLSHPKTGPTDCDPGKLPVPLGRGDRGSGEAHHCLEAWAEPSWWPWWGLWALQDTALSPFWAPSSPAGPRPGQLEGLREKAGIRLSPLSPPHHHRSTVV